MPQEKQKGTFRISRWHSNGDQSTGITISLVDELSNSECVEIHCTVEALGMALTCSQQECEFEWRPQVVGKRAENKTEIVPISFTEKNEKKIAKALAPFEVDGWHARRSDLGNHHCRIPDGKHQRVVFFRHVAP